MKDKNFEQWLNEKSLNTKKLSIPYEGKDEKQESIEFVIKQLNQIEYDELSAKHIKADENGMIVKGSMTALNDAVVIAGTVEPKLDAKKLELLKVHRPAGIYTNLHVGIMKYSGLLPNQVDDAKNEESPASP